jgi:hypothetical protein
LAYAYRPSYEDGTDKLVALAEDLARVTGIASEPGRWLVDSIPIRASIAFDLQGGKLICYTVKHTPDWFPGAGFKRWAKSARKIIDDFATKPYMFAKHTAVSYV